MSPQCRFLSPAQTLKTQYAGMVELVDTQDLGTCTSNGMNTISNVPQTIEMTDFFRFLL